MELCLNSYLVAKTDPQNANLWLPLWIHSRDTAEVMRRLALNWLSDGARVALGMEETTLSKTAYFLGAAHDMGKATVLFQSTITQHLPETRDRLARQCVLPESFVYPRATPHARASEAILLQLGCPEGIASIAGAHHGKPQENSGEYIDENMELYKNNYFGKGEKDLWFSLWKQMLEQHLRDAGFASVEDLPILSIPQELLLTGMLIMADWIASNTRFFPLLSVEDLGRESLYPNRFVNGWERVHLPDPWQTLSYLPMDKDSFQNRFGFSPNEVQQAVLDVAASMETPGLLILEAQMGVGKTEAALAAAETFAAKWGAGGLFFGLPTQATANGIFGRLTAWAQTQSEDTVHSIRLAHGMAELNEDYRELFPGRALVEKETPEEGVYVHPWFQGHKQALLADFVIGTVDQLLMVALKQRHLMLRHLGVAGKVVVIDEVHAYDAYMNTYLDRALSWLGRYQVPVILLSATLPAQRREELVAAYLGVKTVGRALFSNRGYPLLTWTAGTSVQQQVVELSTKQRQVTLQTATEHALSRLLEEALAEGGCAGIIVNTVKKAQTLARQLQERMKDSQVFLFHAQFLMPDRAERERVLLERLGKRSTAVERDKLIVVGTQVLEQSLDIDFDLLVTELCPMDLLLQRIGREHRHPSHDPQRPPRLREARCIVLTAEDGFDEGSKAVYGEWLLWRTQRLLPTAVRLPEDISSLVQNTYGWGEQDVLSETEESKHAWELYQLKEKSKQERARSFTILPPRKRKTLSRPEVLDDWMGKEGAHSETQARAAVRDGDPSIEVLVMMRYRDGSVRFLPWQEGGVPVPTDGPPSQEESRAIARQRLRLPGYFSRRWTIDDVIGELEEQNRRFLAPWQQAPMLCGELVLLLDEEFSASLAGTKLVYDKERGLTYGKEEACEGDGV